MPNCLMVEKSDEYGDLDYQENGINIRTKPKDRNEQFREFGCAKHEFLDEKLDSAPECPYHMPGGLKERWDNIGGIKKYDAEKQRKEKARLAAKAKALRKEQDSEGCCIVQ